MKKIIIAISVVITVIIAGYLYIRYVALKSKDFKPDNSKAKSILDLRPGLIARLRQMVKDGSNGLYTLTIGDIQPHIRTGGVDMVAVKIIPDSLRLASLKGSPAEPAEVFRISLDSFHIDGLGIEELLHRDQIDLGTISLLSPVIEMYTLHKSPTGKKDSVTLYQRLMQQVKRISVNEVLVQHGMFINHSFGKKNETVKLADIEIKLDHILIDSSTQYDAHRFLFAAESEIEARNLSTRTTDGLYVIKCGSLKISTDKNEITAHDITARPVYNRKEFESRLTTRKYLYDLNIPQLKVTGIDWWEMINGKSFIAKEAVMENGSCAVYLDRSLPFRKMKQNNFPQQILMRSPVPFSIARMDMHHTKLLYSEHNPAMDQTGTVEISDISGSVEHISNIRREILKHRFLVSKSSGLFMNHVPIAVGFHFDLLHYKTGKFTMDLKVSGMDSAILNPITGPLAEFIIKRGSIRQGVAHVEGDNFRANGKGMLLYKDLYLVSVGEKAGEPGKIKKKKLLSFIGNVLLIKNANPREGKPVRYENFDSRRNIHQPFFSLVWKTIFIGILKTIGLPPRFADKKY